MLETVSADTTVGDVTISSRSSDKNTDVLRTAWTRTVRLRKLQSMHLSCRRSTKSIFLHYRQRRLSLSRLTQIALLARRLSLIRIPRTSPLLLAHSQLLDPACDAQQQQQVLVKSPLGASENGCLDADFYRYILYRRLSE